MTVKKLIEILSKQPQYAEVYGHDPENGFGNFLEITASIVDEDGDVILA